MDRNGKPHGIPSNEHSNSHEMSLNAGDLHHWANAFTGKKIARKGSDTVDDLKDKFDELLNNLNEKFAGAKEEVTDLYEKGRDKASDIKKEVKNAMN